MEPLRPTPPRLEASGKFVHDDHLVVAHHVIFVALKKRLRAHRRFQMVNIFDAFFGIDIFNPECVLGFFNPAIGELDRFQFLINRVIFVLLEMHGNAGKCPVEVFGLLRGSGNNKWSARFIYQDGVYFVHDCIVVFSLDQRAFRVYDIVAKVIKAEFIIRTIGDVRRVRFTPGTRAQELVKYFKRAELITLFVQFFVGWVIYV